MPHPYAFNLFNHNTAVDPETGYNDEETVIKETAKIFEDDRIAVGDLRAGAGAARALRGHHLRNAERPITEDQVRAILSPAPGVKIVDDRANNYFPMPVDASGQDDVLVGRIRKDLSDPSGHSISIFVAADQLLKGAGLNATDRRIAAAARWREPTRHKVGLAEGEPLPFMPAEQARVAVGIEPVARGDGVGIGPLHRLKTAERRTPA